MGRGFTLIELLVVIGIVAVLMAFAIPIYQKFTDASKKTAVISDLRNCLAHIQLSLQSGQASDVNDAVSECVKGRYTNEIVVESTNPLKLKAISTEGELYCSYDENTGEVQCDNVYQ